MIKSFQDLPFKPFSTLQIYQLVSRLVLSFYLFLHSIKFTILNHNYSQKCFRYNLIQSNLILP